YDDLVEELGGPSTPAIGFALGIDRIALCLEGETRPLVLAFVAAAGPEDVPVARRVAKTLRRAGVPTDADLGRGKLGAQLKRADRVGARRTIIVGPDEREKGGVTVRDMATNEQR